MTESTARVTRRYIGHERALTNFIMDMELEGIEAETAATIASMLLRSSDPAVHKALKYASWRPVKKRILRSDDERHGSWNGYANYGCRCEPCKQAASDVMKGMRAERIKKGLPPGDDRHGTYNGYVNYGCRCDLCKQAGRDFVLGQRDPYTR